MWVWLVWWPMGKGLGTGSMGKVGSWLILDIFSESAMFSGVK